MSHAPLVAFNLLLNGAGSFFVGALFALAASRALRTSPGRATVFLWTLPFAKLVYDLAHGVPRTSFLWLRARGISQDLGAFRMGVGVERVVPKLDLELGALWHGALYPQSAADLLASALTKRVSPQAPAVIVELLIAGVAPRLARRARELARSLAERRRVTALAPPREVRTVALRRVPVYVVPGLEGSPFTAGLLRPFVAFPERLWISLTPDEREAALQHELSHVAELHVAWLFVAGLVSDLFWFVPFVDRAHARLAAACECAADALALRRGASPLALASALVRTRELAPRALRPAHSLGAARGSLSSRVALLLRADDAPPASPARRAARALFVAWVAAAVALAVPVGNH